MKKSSASGSVAAARDRKSESNSPPSFEELARELECDEDENAFKAKLRQIARATRPDKTGGQTENGE